MTTMTMICQELNSCWAGSLRSECVSGVPQGPSWGVLPSSLQREGRSEQGEVPERR